MQHTHTHYPEAGGKPGTLDIALAGCEHAPDGRMPASGVHYAAQARLCSYMLGCLQGVLPERALLVTRDCLADPFPVEITSPLDGKLDPDRAPLRDHLVEIKVNVLGTKPVAVNVNRKPLS